MHSDRSIALALLPAVTASLQYLLLTDDQLQLQLQLSTVPVQLVWMWLTPRSCMLLMQLLLRWVQAVLSPEQDRRWRHW